MEITMIFIVYNVYRQDIKGLIDYMFSGVVYMGGNFRDSSIDINFSGDLCGLNSEELTDYVISLIKKYPVNKELFDISVYVKKFKTDSSGRPLIFSSFVADTKFGLVASDSTEWGFRNSLRQGIKSLLLNVNRNYEEQIERNYDSVYG